MAFFHFTPNHLSAEHWATVQRNPYIFFSTCYQVSPNSSFKKFFDEQVLLGKKFWREAILAGNNLSGEKIAKLAVLRQNSKLSSREMKYHLNCTFNCTENFIKMKKDMGRWRGTQKIYIVYWLAKELQKDWIFCK